MNDEAPLRALVHRLSETPPDFLAEPLCGGKGQVDVAAVVSDLSRALGGPLLDAATVASLRSSSPAAKNRIRLALIGAWLLHDEWFRAQQRFAAPAITFLVNGIEEVAALVDAAKFVTDPDRREELVRLAFRALGIRAAGESEAQAADRLSTLSSVERQRVISETRDAQERMRQIRAAMKKKAAEEAAAAYGRE